MHINIISFLQVILSILLYKTLQLVVYKNNSVIRTLIFDKFDCFLYTP